MQSRVFSFFEAAESAQSCQVLALFGTRKRGRVRKFLLCLIVFGSRAGPSPSAPAGALFTKSHEFVAIGEDSLAVCGVSAHAVELLGEVVYVELPSVGDKVSRGKAFGVVESVKAASDVYAPVSGEVSCPYFPPLPCWCFCTSFPLS